VYSLVQLGELREAASRGSRWLRGAQEIGDLYGKTSLEIHLTAPTLAADQGEAAAAQLEATVSGWSQGQFTPQHLLAVTDAAKCELYRGNPAAAWNVINGAWAAAEHSMGWQFTRVMAFYFHAGSAVALARQQPSQREQLLTVAKQEAQVVHQEGRHYSRGVAGILRAGIAMTEGQTETALQQLEEAIAGFTEAEMALHAAVARRRKGELLGGANGQALIAEADAAMEAQGIRKPQQWADMYAPGFRSS
jgi:eukaryotic-like serine/threonine-protein kinase